jgi:hypothetical protein
MEITEETVLFDASITVTWEVIVHGWSTGHDGEDT